MAKITATLARDILEKIPYSEWGTSTHDCALSHLSKATGHRFALFSFEGKIGEFRRQTSDFMQSKFGIDLSIVAVNDKDGEIRPHYPQATPKDRVIMLLSDMIAAGY